ncbi:COQ9 family protein [Marinovum sp. 2_MG-2023]|uniref:COQ9 family protein n=1 Tax=unclassified Marinovum TaxID=2647166 RepID=UPI0026E22CDD|nr:MULTISPECIES: COQ9 family protein [unclassified Marinovum]MDO6730110.1 COQ9 family protein [Marinovum sp. 2_MG-2023]MDO6779924.1 COQ9 family protein [Marinovum sp. 1_MG-2023]
MTDPKEQLLDAALAHVAFDGWGDDTFRAAIEDSGVNETVARAICPRGAVDLALAFHRRGDAAMVARLHSTDLAGMRFRDRIAFAVRARLEAVTDKEAVRRGTTLFSLPHHAADGARAIWDTCDAIWTTLGDTSDDVNWYTKRATLSAVYGATVLYWLGDDTPDHSATWEFLDRRIDNVMQVEKLKAQVQEHPLLSKLMAGPNAVLANIRAPQMPDDLPGRWTQRSSDT